MLASFVSAFALIQVLWEAPATLAVALAFTLAFGFWASCQLDD